jgi:hypothetical protein
VSAAPIYTARFFFEWGSGGVCLWGADERTTATFGYAIENARLPLSPATILLLDELCSEHDGALNWHYPPDPGPWRQPQCDSFNARTAAAFATLIGELGPAWEVIDAFESLVEDPDLDRYLADPQALSR